MLQLLMNAFFRDAKWVFLCDTPAEGDGYIYRSRGIRGGTKHQGPSHLESTGHQGPSHLESTGHQGPSHLEYTGHQRSGQTSGAKSFRVYGVSGAKSFRVYGASEEGYLELDLLSHSSCHTLWETGFVWCLKHC